MLAVVLASRNVQPPRPSAGGCTVTTNPLAFPPYDPSSGQPEYGLGAIAFSCSLSVTISLSRGNGTYAQREMKDASGNKLRYNIYTDLTFSNVWGDGTPGTATVAANTGLEPLVPVAGRIPARQSVEAGRYADTIAVTVAF